jgi:hypothetical protein
MAYTRSTVIKDLEKYGLPELDTDESEEGYSSYATDHLLLEMVKKALIKDGYHDFEKGVDKYCDYDAKAKDMHGNTVYFEFKCLSQSDYIDVKETLIFKPYKMRKLEAFTDWYIHTTSENIEDPTRDQTKLDRDYTTRYNELRRTILNAESSYKRGKITLVDMNKIILDAELKLSRLEQDYTYTQYYGNKINVQKRVITDEVKPITRSILVYKYGNRLFMYDTANFEQDYAAGIIKLADLFTKKTEQDPQNVSTEKELIPHLFIPFHAFKVYKFRRGTGTFEIYNKYHEDNLERQQIYRVAESGVIAKGESFKHIDKVTCTKDCFTHYDNKLENNKDSIVMVGTYIERNFNLASDDEVKINALKHSGGLGTTINNVMSYQDMMHYLNTGEYDEFPTMEEPDDLGEDFTLAW